MPETVMTAIAESGRERTRGSKSQMTGSANTATTAVKTIKTAVSLSWKYLSTRYLSMWVEMAQESGPRMANSNQCIVRMLHHLLESEPSWRCPRKAKRKRLSPCERKHPLRRYRQLRHTERQAQRIVDRGRNGGPDGGDARFAGAFDPQRVQRTWRIFGQKDFDRGHFACGRHEIIGEGHGERLSVLAVEEFLVQGAAQSLRVAAHDLAFDHHRVDRASDVISDEEPLHEHGAGFAIDAHLRCMDPIGIGHVVGVVPAFGAQAAGLLMRDLAKRDGGPRFLSAPHDNAVDDVEGARGCLQQLGSERRHFGAQIERAVMSRASRHHRGARGVRADAIGDAVGLAVDHRNAAIVDAERVGADLRHHGLEALPQ